MKKLLLVLALSGLTLSGLAVQPALARSNYHGRRFYFEGTVLTITHNQLVVRGLDKDKKLTTINFVLPGDVEFKSPRESFKEGDAVKVDYDYTLESEVYKACIVSQVNEKPKAKVGKQQKKKK